MSGELRASTALSMCLLALAGVGPALGQESRTPPEEGRFTFTEPHMGTSFRLVLHAPDRDVAAEAARAAFSLVARLDSLLSDYRPDSEVAALAALAGTGTPLGVSPDLWAVTGSALAWSRRSGGAYDPTVGPLTRLWRWSARRGELPDSGRLARARAAVGSDKVLLDSLRRSIALTRPGMSLDLGGIAKGFTADRVLEELKGRGIGAALVDAGGDVVVGDPPPGQDGWRIRIPPAHPGGEPRVLLLSRAAVATSGDAERHVVIEGVRYAHLVDPRSGLGLPSAPTVTVIARDGTTADVLASALSVLGPAEGRALLATVPGAEARSTGAKPWTSPGFSTLLPPTPTGGVHR